jgi:voltage-gated potassium channel
MQFLGFVWLALLVLELTRGLSPALVTVSTVIWVLFIVDFAIRLALAPARLSYMKANWLGALSLLVPALRVLRIARVARVVRLAPAARGLRLVRVVSSINRTMRALGNTMSRRGIGYVIALTMVVTLVGAAGLYAFERELPDGQGLDDFTTALWWTGTIITTMGTDYWPVTGAGRVLCLLLGLYSFAVFGYVTAALASFFIGQDAHRDDTEIAGARALEALRLEIAGLRAEVRGFRIEGGDQPA